MATNRELAEALAFSPAPGMTGTDPGQRGGPSSRIREAISVSRNYGMIASDSPFPASSSNRSMIGMCQKKPASEI